MGVSPSKPVRIVVPFAAGGKTGSAEVSKAAADGHTLLMGTVGTHAINPALYPKMPCDDVKDYVPVTLVAGVPNRPFTCRQNSSRR